MAHERRDVRSGWLVLVAVLSGGCVRAGFDSLSGTVSDSAADQRLADQAASDSPFDSGPQLDGACRSQQLTILTDNDDGEVDHKGEHLPQGEAASTWTTTDPDAIYIGYWVDWVVTAEGYTRGYFRFRLKQPIPAGATVTAATFTLHGLTAPESYADWNAATHALRVYVEDAADAPPVTNGTFPGMITDSVRWPSSGGLAWKLNDDNAVDVAPLLRALAQAYGGLATGAHVQLWLQGDFTGIRAEVATPDIGRPGAKPARLELQWCE